MGGGATRVFRDEEDSQAIRIGNHYVAVSSVGDGSLGIRAKGATTFLQIGDTFSLDQRCKITLLSTKRVSTADQYPEIWEASTDVDCPES